MRMRPQALATCLLAAGIVGAVACLPGTGPPLLLQQDDSGPPPTLEVNGDASLRYDVDLGDPFAIVGLLPSHGPWTGGTRTVVTGRGFSSSLQVTIGANRLDPSAVVASSPTQAAIITPAGTPGPADVQVTNVATAVARTLAAGFLYDAFAVTPDSGATTGGTRITLQGSGTHWTSASVITVGGQPCTAVAVTDATHAACSTPPGSPGSNDVKVTNADGSDDQAQDAFTYSDSPDGYRGGLFGGALAGSIQVLAFDSLTGTPLAGAVAIAGSTLATAVTGVLNASGAVVLDGAGLSGKVTVTVAAKCHQPVTFVDVPVNTVTAYLAPELATSCQGDPPSSGAFYPVELGGIAGELVWTGGIEFTKAPWGNVPAPRGAERLAAYVFTTTSNQLATFQLPSADSATTPASTGVLGYAYQLSAYPGNQSLYALAGLEDRSVTPPRFEAYAMGVAHGVLVQPGAQSAGVDIPMTAVLDHSLATVPLPPTPTPRGPDRLFSELAIDVGAGQFAILPQGTITAPLPVSGGLSFIGVPSLGGSLASAAYEITSAAVTGPSLGLPASVLSGIETTDGNDPLTISGFLGIPTMSEPSTGQWGGTHVTMQASGAFDLAVVNVSSGNGLVVWQIIAPSSSSLSFDLPDLSQVMGVGSLVHGPISTTFTIARVDSFDYGQLRYGQLSGGAWSAYAQDVSTGSY